MCVYNHAEREDEQADEAADKGGEEGGVGDARPRDVEVGPPRANARARSARLPY